MDRVRQAFRQMPLVPRCLVAGAVVGAALGAGTGFVIGMRAYPPTAWAAAVEVAIPASILLATAAAAVGFVVHASRRHGQAAKRSATGHRCSSGTWSASGR